MSYNQFNPEVVLRIAIDNMRKAQGDLDRLNYLVFREFHTRDSATQVEAQRIVSLLRGAEKVTKDLLNNEDWSWSEEE